ncbi:MAG: protein kinase [Gemmatimonas sp.]
MTQFDVALASLIEERVRAAPIDGRYGNLGLLSADGHTSLVFEAEDLRTTRRVVLKFLKPSSNQYRADCFRREVQVTRALVGHRNIVQIAGAAGDYVLHIQDSLTGIPIQLALPFFAMERARSDFAALLIGAHRKPRTLVRRLEVVRDVVLGVIRLHHVGYCHRDLKPDNILLFQQGVAKLGDLGTCRRHDGSEPFAGEYFDPPGNRNYAAPEMFNGGANIPALYRGGDWFSVGAVLFEAVTGQNLYVAIGLTGVAEVVQALQFGGTLNEFTNRVGETAGKYPIPSSWGFLGESWMHAVSDRTHQQLTGLMQDLCHFDYRRRLTDGRRILQRLDLTLALARQDAARQFARRRRVL